MSALERRVQILLDQIQYEQVQREAARTRQSVAAVIRDAIGARLASGDAARAAAAQRLLASADRNDSPAEDWAEVKSGLEQSVASKLS